MKNILLILIIALFPALNNAEEKKVFIEVTNETDLKNYEWTNRPLAVFAPLLVPLLSELDAPPAELLAKCRRAAWPKLLV